jgi:hypothetical protein
MANTSGLGNIDQIAGSNMGSGMMPTGGMGGMTGFEPGMPLLNNQSIANPNMNWGDAGNPFVSPDLGASISAGQDFAFGAKL